MAGTPTRDGNENDSLDSVEIELQNMTAAHKTLEETVYATNYQIQLLQNSTVIIPSDGNILVIKAPPSKKLTANLRSSFFAKPSHSTQPSPSSFAKKMARMLYDFAHPLLFGYRPPKELVQYIEKMVVYLHKTPGLSVQECINYLNNKTSTLAINDRKFNNLLSQIRIMADKEKPHQPLLSTKRNNPLT